MSTDNQGTTEQSTQLTKWEARAIFAWIVAGIAGLVVYYSVIVSRNTSQDAWDSFKARERAVICRDYDASRIDVAAGQVIQRGGDDWAEARKIVRDNC
jgi:hypothetical protein